MDKVIKVLDSEINKIKESIEKNKEIINSGLDDVKLYSNALKIIGPKLEELEKLNKVRSFVNTLNGTPNVVKVSKRGRPKKI